MTESPSKRRHYGYATTRQAILDAARDIMREEGVGALSLHEVARRVGLKTPSLYTYFASKHALYDALFAQGMKMYRDRSEVLIAKFGMQEESIEVMIRDYMLFADENPDLYALLFERPVPGFVPSQESMTDISAVFQTGTLLFQQAIDSGTIDSGLSARQTQDLLLAVMHGLTALKRANEPHLPIGEGRFGSLIPAAVALLKAAWIPKRSLEKENAAG